MCVCLLTLYFPQKLPRDISTRRVLLVDPMLATGESAREAIRVCALSFHFVRDSAWVCAVSFNSDQGVCTFFSFVCDTV